MLHSCNTTVTLPPGLLLSIIILSEQVQPAGWAMLSYVSLNIRRSCVVNSRRNWLSLVPRITTKLSVSEHPHSAAVWPGSQNKCEGRCTWTFGNTTTLMIFQFKVTLWDGCVHLIHPSTGRWWWLSEAHLLCLLNLFPACTKQINSGPCVSPGEPGEGGAGRLLWLRAGSSIYQSWGPILVIPVSFDYQYGRKIL